MDGPIPRVGLTHNTVPVGGETPAVALGLQVARVTRGRGRGGAIDRGSSATTPAECHDA